MTNREKEYIIKYSPGRHSLPYTIGVKLRKGGTAMDVKVILDWKTVAALGASVVAIIFAVKMDAESAETVSTHAVDAVKEFAIAKDSNR